MSEILEGVFIMGPNGRSPIHIEAAVVPGEHVFDNRVGDLAFSFEHFEHCMAEELYHIMGFCTRRDTKIVYPDDPEDRFNCLPLSLTIFVGM